MLKVDSRARLSQLRALRRAGKTTFDTYKVKAAEDLYEEVDESRYNKIVRDRLNQDDFVVDDNGEGYADDGREEWDRPSGALDHDSEDDERAGSSHRRSRKNAKTDHAEAASKVEANDKDISTYFTKSANKPQPKLKVEKTKDDDSFMDSLLDNVDIDVPTAARTFPSKSKRERPADKRRGRDVDSLHIGAFQLPAPKKKKMIDTRLPSPPSIEHAADEDEFFPMEDFTDMLPDIPSTDLTPSSPTAKVAERKALAKAEPTEGDNDDDMMEVAHAGTVMTSSVNLDGLRPPRALPKPDPYLSPVASSPPKAPELAMDPTSWNELTESLNVVSNLAAEADTTSKFDYVDAVEADGSLNIFWTDYAEVNASLCLFGKVLNKKTKSFESCFIKIDNILRKLYFLPRKCRTRDGVETTDGVEMMDVYQEVDDIVSKMGVNMHKIKPCTRKYAFELSNIPKEAQYLKLLYPYSKPALQIDQKGETFSAVFGTTTALFEQFVLWKNVMGPCWLKITDGNFSSLKNASHCKLEVLVLNPDNVSVLTQSEAPEVPPMTLMAIALRTVFNVSENKPEILAISARIYENVSLGDTTPAEKLPCRAFTIIRPNGPAFPVGFELVAKRRNRGLVRAARSESEMFMFFLAQMELADPDVILGHQLEGVDYSILLNRLQSKKIHQWSRLGRLHRAQWPGAIGRTGGNVFAERQVMAGRLLCDLFNDHGKSAMSKCQSWSLSEMCSIYLSSDNLRRDVDNDAALKTWATTKEGLLDYITHMEADTHFITALALRVQLLPLAKVLTNIAGNSWARTLTGTRAERNEFILLHEFHRNKYICPDKQPARGRGRNQQQYGAPDEEREDGDGVGGTKKDKYKGGLVFEPEKGLYDKFVLVMDFNSLYPSIIQEFNICFTTVERSDLSKDEDAVPEVPVACDQGILPRLISSLVSRRRQVKSLMKDKNTTAEQLATWDTKQLALKLTANSMYGCLGYAKSRFYARPLAVLITSKGREILRSTKELAESKSLRVIYGDTDSVMINANVDTVLDALRVGADFKRAVNERYRLLEIDIDNLYRRILLQAKKKYAAVQLVQQDGCWLEKMEVKGLDMKRREFCALSKEVSARLLAEILSGNDLETSVAKIHEYLREVAAKMRDGAVLKQKYIVFQQLGKEPGEYPNGDSMPQVQVALRDLARGKRVRRGDVIGFIITGDAKSGDPPAKRAFAPVDVRPDTGLSPDVEWYLSRQILPPVERLCANIVGTSPAQLAEQLGLDIRRYTSNQQQQQQQSYGGGGGGVDLELHPLESQVPDQLRFRDCARLSLRCRACRASAVFEGLAAAPDRVTASGLLCPACGATLAPLSVLAQLEHAVRVQTARYYEGWLVCDDTSCGIRTRQMSVYGTRCLGPRGHARDCLGRMRYEYGEKAIYNQLVYFAALFDVDKARAAARRDDGPVLSPADRDRVDAMAAHNRVRFDTLKSVVDRYLDKCGRQWVAMDTLFTKLGFLKAA